MLEAEDPPALGPWFRVYPDRFAEERSALEAMGFVFDEKWFAEAEEVIFRGTLSAYPDRNIIITFPFSYPSIAPRVTDDGNCPLLTRHQKPSNRAYCLYGAEKKAWWAGLDAVHLIGELEILIRDVLAGNGSAEDVFPEPFSMQVSFGKLGTILVPPGVSDFSPDDLSQVAEGLIEVNYEEQSQPNGTARGVVVGAGFRGKSEKAAALRSYQVMIDGKEKKGRLTFLPNLEAPILDGEGLLAVLKRHGITLQGNYPWHAVIFPEQNGDRSTTRYAWLLFRAERNGRWTPLRTITYRSAENSARIPGLEFLPSKRVAVIGCGAIGSKVACALASSGVRSFVLVDRDSMEPANTVRHECGVHLFAIPKVDALMGRILSLNPDASGGIKMLRGDPFDELPQNLRKEFSADLERCDLIVDATGHAGVSRAICEIGERLLTPSVHVSVTNGVWSGEIFRYLPGVSRCWQCFQTAFSNSPPEQPLPLGQVFGPGCDQPTFTGTGYDLNVVAGLATSFVVDTLRVADGKASEYGGDYVLWEGRDSTGKLLQRTTVFDVPSRETCQTCSKKA